MARYATSRDTKVRVDVELHEWLKDLAKRNGTSIVKTSKLMARQHREVYYQFTTIPVPRLPKKIRLKI